MENRELGGDYHAVYVSLWVRFSSNWFGHPSGSNKILHFWIDGRNKVVFKAEGQRAGPLAIQIHLQGVAQNPRSFDLRPNQGGGRFSRGEWHHLEVLLRANTGGDQNGEARWWVDGQSAGSHSNLAILRANQKHTWEKVSWNPTWGGTSGTLPNEQSMDIDHIYISGQ